MSKCVVKSNDFRKRKNPKKLQLPKGKLSNEPMRKNTCYGSAINERFQRKLRPSRYKMSKCVDKSYDVRKRKNQRGYTCLKNNKGKVRNEPGRKKY